MRRTFPERFRDNVCSYGPLLKLGFVFGVTFVVFSFAPLLFVDPGSGPFVMSTLTLVISLFTVSLIGATIVLCGRSDY